MVLSKGQIRLVNFTIKLLLILAVGYLLFDRLVKNKDIGLYKENFLASLDSSNIWYLVVAILIMPLNWLLEAKKWQMLLRAFVKIPFPQSFKAIMSGITLAVVTPGRVGEYGGRITLLDSKHNWHGLVATFVSSISQNICNVLFGYIGASVFLLLYVDMDKFTSVAFILMGLIVLILAFLFYFNIDILRQILNKVLPNTLLNRINKPLKMLDGFRQEKLMLALRFSSLRYLIYLSQYVLILKAFGIGMPIIAGVSGVAMIYLIQSGIPLPPVLGIIARGEIALFIWSIFTDNALGILSATFSLWFINLLFPTLIGLFFVLNVNILRSFGYENE